MTMNCPTHNIELTLLRNEIRRNVYICEKYKHPVFEMLSKEEIKKKQDELKANKAERAPMMSAVKVKPSNIIRNK